MRYVVTGGAGFIGSNTVDELVKRGHSVVVLDDLSAGKEENLAEIRLGSRESRVFFVLDVELEVEDAPDPGSRPPITVGCRARTRRGPPRSPATAGKDQRSPPAPVGRPDRHTAAHSLRRHQPQSEIGRARSSLRRSR